MPKLIDLTGQRFSELLVEGLAESKLRNRPAWVCLCDCGQRKTVSGDSLKAGDAKCCGNHKTKHYLHSLASRSKIQNRKYPEGSDSNSRLYTLWRAMLWRCSDPLHEAYPRYGGAGITVCDAWLNYESFRSWAVGGGYACSLTLDRKNNSIGYSPENCQWATPKQQARNRTKGLRLMKAFGLEKALVEWAEDPRCVVSYRTLAKRIRAGQPPEFALTATEHQARRRAQWERKACGQAD